MTKTAIKWLEEKQVELGANSLSDALEKMARKKEYLSSFVDNCLGVNLLDNSSWSVTQPDIGKATD